MFPITRPRRLRGNNTIRSLVREASLSPNHFIMPLFIVPGSQHKVEISSLPNQFHFSIDLLQEEVLVFWYRDTC
jgi:porphobilinogen synthase